MRPDHDDYMYNAYVGQYTMNAVRDSPVTLVTLDY